MVSPSYVEEIANESIFHVPVTLQKDRCLCEPHYYIAALQCPSSIGLDPYDFSHVVGIGTMPSAPTKIICHRSKCPFGGVARWGGGKGFDDPRKL